MSDPSARTFSADFKRFFLRGLVVLLPTVLTLWIIVQAYRFVDKTIADPINDGLKAGLVQLTSVCPPLKRAFDPNQDAIRTEHRMRYSEPAAPRPLPAAAPATPWGCAAG